MLDLYDCKVATSVVIYCLSVSAVPIYNKEVFTGGIASHRGGLHKFPYPVATAVLQLALVSFALGLANIVGHLFASPRGASSEGRASWIFGPHFGYKLRYVAPVGILFGFKYGLTNWGLQLLPTGTHLLLQSTDLIWTVATARVWNKEKLGCVEFSAAILATVGSVLIGLHAGQTLEAPTVPLLVNCLTPLLLALCISTLRSGAKELFRADNRLQGSVTPTEFTALKLFVSACMALLLSFMLEGGAGTEQKAAWWTALQGEPLKGTIFLLVGGVFVLIFQVNITWLSGLTSAVTVGVVGGIKVVPQWCLNALFLGLNINVSPLNLGGAAMVLFASCLYAYSISRMEMLSIGWKGLRWEMRESVRNPPLLAADRLDTPSKIRTLEKSPSVERLVTHSSLLDVSVSLNSTG